jgi:phage baseplate assembly protein W
MAKGVYVGFTTQNIYQATQSTTVGIGEGTGNLQTQFRSPARFRTLDEQLVIQDLVNAFSIQQGSLPGKPEYGTTIWAYVFDQATPETLQALQNEVTRVISLDPRVTLNTINAFFQDNGVLILVEISITQYNTALTTGFFLNRTSGQVSQV